ncbi:hypothetical protein [Hyalangium rubrum]|uniref:Lipoprotein n=1 Tax=Hyalangium rubrum TaxID=3103134 RepID=A0ABU5H1Q4_9BACT|nr:hypothetical protein [Hyalangium sp. s54d21]MDY7227325.1 hypothetical protein [Hyalangium sp. s54d21]
MKRTFSTLAVAGLLALASTACGVDADPALACTELCTTSGFTSGNADVYEHEVNCFCDGGDASARVSADACTQTCRDMGWSEGEAFASSACQCS